MAALEHGSAFFASLKEKKKKLCIAFAAINARIKHMQTLGSDAVLGWRIDIFCPPGRTILPTFFFFSVVYRLVGCDSSFCLCRVFFCFSLCLVWVRHYLSTRFPVCACVCVAVFFARNVFGYCRFGCHAIFSGPLMTRRDVGLLWASECRLNCAPSAVPIDAEYICSFPPSAQTVKAYLAASCAEEVLAFFISYTSQETNNDGASLSTFPFPALLRTCIGGFSCK